MFQRRLHIDNLKQSAGSKILVPNHLLIEGWNSYFTNFNLFDLFNIVEKLPILLLLSSWLSYFLDNYTFHHSMQLRSWFANSNAIFDPRNHVPCNHVVSDGTIIPSLMRMCYFHGFPTIMLRASALTVPFGRLFLVSCVTAKWHYKRSIDAPAYRIINPLLITLTLIEMTSLATFLVSTSHLDSVAVNKIAGIIFVFSTQLTMMIINIVVTRLEAPTGKYSISNYLIAFFAIFGITAPISLLFYFQFQNERPCMVTVPAYIFAMEVVVHVSYVGFYFVLKHVLKDIMLPIFGTMDDVLPKPTKSQYTPRILFGKEQGTILDRALTRPS